MKIQNVPPSTLQACVTLLQPHCPELSPTTMVKALREFDTSPSRTAERFLSKHEAAQMLGVTWHTVCRWARNGQIPTVKIGRDWRFPLSKLEAMANDDDGEG